MKGILFGWERIKSINYTDFKVMIASTIYEPQMVMNRYVAEGGLWNENKCKKNESNEYR